MGCGILSGLMLGFQLTVCICVDRKNIGCESNLFVPIYNHNLQKNKQASKQTNIYMH
jgi:hypothetical protein